MVVELVTGVSVDFASAEELAPGVEELRKGPKIVRGNGRLIQTHEPYRAGYACGIYIVRDVRDVVVSNFHYRQWLREYRGDLAGFVKLFVDGRVNSYGTWPAHVSGWLNAPAGAALTIKYEDLVRDPIAELGRVGEFLGVSRDHETLAKIVQRNALGEMRRKEDQSFVGVRRDDDHRFVRKGKVGGWEDELTAADLALIRAHSAPLMERLGYDFHDRVGTRSLEPS